MTETDLITAWLEEPQLVRKEPKNRIGDLIFRFPLFYPLQYLKVLQDFDYQGAPLNTLGELFSYNRVLIYRLFYPYKDEPKESETKSVTEGAKSLKLDLPPLSATDYFGSQGLKVENGLPESEKEKAEESLTTTKDLMVVMTFSQWLSYLERQTQKTREEEEGKRALKAMWQREKLSGALEDEEEEIPENVFHMAVESITPQEELVSESLADVYALQGKKAKALDMYKKLILQIPEKSTYFAAKIEDLQKDLDV